MNDNFNITNLIKKLIIDFDKYLTNFPNKEIELKREIMNTSYNMLKITYEANTTYNKDKRIDIQEKLVSYIKYLDFLINRCYEKTIINSKRYLKFGENLDYLLKYINGWIKNTSIVGSRYYCYFSSTNWNYNGRNINTSGSISNNNLYNYNSGFKTNYSNFRLRLRTSIHSGNKSNSFISAI